MRLTDENADLKRRLEESEEKHKSSPPFLTGYTRERCKEQEIGIERLIGKQTGNRVFFRGTPSRVPES